MLKQNTRPKRVKKSTADILKSKNTSTGPGNTGGKKPMNDPSLSGSVDRAIRVFGIGQGKRKSAEDMLKAARRMKPPHSKKKKK